MSPSSTGTSSTTTCWHTRAAFSLLKRMQPYHPRRILLTRVPGGTTRSFPRHPVLRTSSILVCSVICATSSQHQLAAQIHTAIDKVKFWLEQVHQDAKQLVVLTPAQLSLPSTLSTLDDMVTQTQLAYSGENDPLTGQQQGGVSWICSNIQRM